MKQKMLLLGAVIFGVLAFIFTYQQINLERAAIQGEALDVYLIEVQRDIPENEKITDDLIKQKKVRRFRNSLSSSREIPFDQKSVVIGREVRSLVTAGKMLQWDDLKMAAASGKSGLTAMIRPGFRAISIPVNQYTSVTGMVQPNNFVDIVGTFKFPERQGDRALDTVTLTILQRVRVIATGTDMGFITPGSRAQLQGRSYSTVTLELTPKEVEMIIFTLQKAGSGSLFLSLRNYEESKITYDLQSVDFNYLQKNYRQYNMEREKMMKRGMR